MLFRSPAMVDICPICGHPKPSDSPFVKIRDTVIQGHIYCVDHLIEASEKMGSMKLLAFNKIEFLKSLLIAFLILLGVTGVIGISAYYGFFVMVASLSGWGSYLLMSLILTKAKVQVGKFQIIVVSVASVLTLFSSIYFGSVIHVFQSVENVDLVSVFKQYFLLLSNNMDTLGKYILINLLIGLGMLVPTIVNSFKQLHQSVNAIKKLK